MRRIIQATLAIICLLPAGLRAQVEVSQEAKVLSLQDAMDYAVKHNDSAKNARLSVLVQKAQNAEVTGLALPNVSSTGQYLDYFNPLKSFIPGEFFGAPGTFIPVQFTPKYNVQASATASQILFDGSVMVALQAKKAILELSRQSARLTEENLRYNVQKAYYAIVIARKNFELIKQSMIASRQANYEVFENYKAGLIEKLESDRSQVQLNNLATDSMRVANMIELSEKVFKLNIGMDMDQPIVLTDTVFEQNLSEAGSLLNEMEDYNNRTEYNLVQSQLNLNQYNLKRHRLSGLPSLAAFASMGYNSSGNKFQDITYGNNYLFSSYYGLRINWPIFDGAQRYNRVRQAKIAVEKSYNNLDLIKKSIDFQVDQSRTNYKNNLLMLESQRRNLDLANNVFTLAQNKYKAGVGSNLEVTTAQNQLLYAQTNYFNSMLDVVNAKTDLQKALGQFR
ncbi:MAG: TolC family protein [Bacteroidetes bacterium]|nr:TolC family protein [Bacteroidota bacterium]